MIEKNFEEIIIRTILKDERLLKAGFKTHYISVPPLLGDSGYDLIWSFEKNGEKYTYAIMLKDHVHSSISKNQIAHLLGSLSESKRKLNGAAIVYSGNASGEVINFAASYNILMIPVTETLSEDWEGRIKNININMTIAVPSILDFKIAFNKDDSKNVLKKANKENYSISFTEDPRKISLFNADGVVIGTLSELLNTYVSKTDKIGTTQISHKFEDPTYLKTEIGNIQLDFIEFKIKIEEIRNPINISGENIEFQFAFSIIRYFLNLNSIPTLKNQNR